MTFLGPAVQTSLHFSIIDQFNAYVFVLGGGGGFWPYTWRQMPESEYEAETFKAYGQCNMIQLTKTSQSVYSHSHLCQGTTICYYSVLHWTGEIYWMKSETFSASAWINIRASDPEEKKKKKNKSFGFFWWKSLTAYQFDSSHLPKLFTIRVTIYGWISQERVTVIFYSTF